MPNADLRQSIQEGLDSGPAMAADDVFDELHARHADAGTERTTRRGGKGKA